MPNPVMRTRPLVYSEGVIESWIHVVWCPGCDDDHAVWSAHPEGTNTGVLWTWDGNREAPTFEPSILVHPNDDDRRCHSYIRDGAWEFLDDCSHALAGQRVPMVPLPDFLVD